MSRTCRNDRPQMTRRAMLGATGTTILGMQVQNLLASAGKNRSAKAEHVILFWTGGGMSHLDTWDPKPGRPTQGEFEPIATSAKGVFISEIFPQLARQMHHCALIRSLTGTQTDHRQATYHLQTGYTSVPNVVHPGLGSIVVRECKKLGEIAAYVSISGRAPRAGYLGRRCEAHFVPSPGEADPLLAFPEGMALEAFKLDDLSAKTLNRYGNTAFGRGALLAKRLVETGVRFVQIHRGGFDTHRNNFPALRAHGRVMDPAIASLVQDLAESGKLETTLIIMLSEFGRTPRINIHAGRDHWPNVFSCFMAGGGIQGGTVVGASDKDGDSPQARPVKVADLHATICHALGIDRNQEGLHRAILETNRGRLEATEPGRDHWAGNVHHADLPSRRINCPDGVRRARRAAAGRVGPAAARRSPQVFLPAENRTQ